MIQIKTNQGVEKCGTPHIKIVAWQDEMTFEDYVIMEGEDNIKVKYCMSKLVDMALE
jgi:hypothetical protein